MKLLFTALLLAGCSSMEADATDRDMTPALDVCDPDAVGQDAGTIVSVYRVAHGQLAGVCFGEQSGVLESSWDALAEVSPPEQLDAVVLLGGFNGGGDTLAFAGPAASSETEVESAVTTAVVNAEFVVAIDLESATEDPAELRLTVVHELAHVFTQTPDQLDPSVDREDCSTFHNGLGCFKQDSFVAAWIAQFWSEEQLASLPGDGAVDEAGGEERCVVDDSFLGAYSASHPEEDFAESFSAYVFAIDIPPGVEDKMDFFSDYPELVAFRDRAAAANHDGLPNNFDRCG